MQLSGRVELQARRRGAARSVAKPAADRAEPRKIRWTAPVGGWLHQLRQPRIRRPRRKRSPIASTARRSRVRPLSSICASCGSSNPASGAPIGPCPPQQLQNPTANYLTPADRAIIRLLRGGPWSSQLQLAEDPEIADLAMRRMLATGRCRWQDLASPPLALGPGRPRPSCLARRRRRPPDDRRSRSTTRRRSCCPPPRPGMSLPGEHLAGPGRARCWRGRSSGSHCRRRR